MTLVSIQSPALPETLLLCPDSEAPEWRAKLEARGNVGRLWTHGELADLVKRQVSREEALKIAEARMLLRADRLWVRPAPVKAEEQMSLA